MIVWMAGAGFFLAAFPALLFLRNLGLYAPPPPAAARRVRCSVLIPARNEEANIAACLESVLVAPQPEMEVVVLDDASTDRTAAIVSEFAQRDPRVRLESAPPLPPGWCGKQHACHVLAGLARQPLLIFLDADVRLEADAIDRMSAFMEQSGAALASGVPRQVTGTISEMLLIPLIHFVMLGFLPIDRMRRTRDPACSAGCGQLFVADATAYATCGGHATIGGALHDGSKLARVFRAAGFATDLFDATSVAECRMYATNVDTWSGLGRAAHEALGSPQLIGPATFLLFGGQILPPALLLELLTGRTSSPLALALAAAGTLAAFAPRLIGVARFRQSLVGAMLHPLGVAALLAINWFAFVRSLRRRPAMWKGRAYTAAQAS
ncbi:MAG: glycosyltransferase family 2 protein [Chthoniobacteraceae bacterium]